MKRMTAEILSFRGVGSMRNMLNGRTVHICDPNTGKTREFYYEYRGRTFDYCIGDVIEFEYTEPSSFFQSFFVRNEMHNIIGRVGNTILDEQLEKLPNARARMVKDSNNPSVATLLSDKDKFDFDFSSSIKLTGSLESITKLTFEAIRSIEGFCFFTPDTESLIDEFTPCLEAQFSVYEWKRGYSINIITVVEPVSDMSAIVHILGIVLEGKDRVAVMNQAQMKISEIIAKLS